MDEWKQVMERRVVQMRRTGWRGLLDYLVALVTRKEQQTIPVPVVVSAWVKTNGAPVKLETEKAQIETGDFNE